MTRASLGDRQRSDEDDDLQQDDDANEDTSHISVKHFEDLDRLTIDPKAQAALSKAFELVNEQAANQHDGWHDFNLNDSWYYSNIILCKDRCGKG